MTYIEIIQMLIDHLPDTYHYPDDQTWTWAWQELSGDAQEAVKTARRSAQKFISEHQQKEN
jgi:hypothetical protein